jgi:hypothetical protein
LGNGGVDQSVVLKKTQFQITVAAFAGGALALLTLAQIFFSFAGLSPAVVITAALHAKSEDISILGLPPYIAISWLDLVIVVVLTLATFMKNRICSVILFLYGVLAFVSSLPTATGHLGIPTILIAIILVFLFSGMTGTFDYHKYQHAQAQGHNDSEQ